MKLVRKQSLLPRTCVYLFGFTLPDHELDYIILLMEVEITENVKNSHYGL